ncbi:MAG: zinc-binding dehydrogenase [Bacteroidota bacterium]
MIQRKIYQLKAGNVKNLQMVEEQLFDPQGEEVLIAVEAIGLNFADVFAIWGLYSATPKGLFTPGLEYAGRVINTGSAVTRLKEGDRVMGVTRFGGYASHICIDQRYLIPVPNDWTMEEGAAYLVQVLTAYYGLKELGNLKENQNILIHSAAGGVGILANRIAKKYKAFTIGSVGNSSKVAFCKKEGYDQVIVRSAHFADDLRKALDGRPLHIVMECIGGKIFEAGFEALAPQGRSVVYGAARYASPGDRPNYPKLLWKHITRPKLDPQSLAEINKGVLGFNLIYLYEQADLMHELLAQIADLQIKKPHVGHTFSFDQLPNAIRLFQTGKTMGKIVVKVEH